MINQVVAKYLQLYPEDKKQLHRLLDQLKDSDELDNRRNFRGHIAGDAIILSPDHKKVLYIYHLRFKKWQQPGGHLESDEDGPWQTAAREAYEETGVKIGQKIGPVSTDYRIPLHIITGPVTPSAAKNEPKHWHHDFRYGFIAKTEKLDEIDDEGIGQARWIPIAEAKKMENSGHNVHKSIDRILSLL
jgi:8-oxo-dGTP pyrophosphatase MutT (NUDIX family)